MVEDQGETGSDGLQPISDLIMQVVGRADEAMTEWGMIREQAREDLSIFMQTDAYQQLDTKDQFDHIIKTQFYSPYRGRSGNHQEVVRFESGKGFVFDFHISKDGRRETFTELKALARDFTDDPDTAHVLVLNLGGEWQRGAVHQAVTPKQYDEVISGIVREYETDLKAEFEG